MSRAGNEEFKVVINHEEQYSIWPGDLATSEKWCQVGPVGSRHEAEAFARTLGPRFKLSKPPTGGRRG